MEPDFSGYATKANVRCTDGRTILADAFAHMDKQRVPLVWQHGHSNPENVLGYAELEHRADGIYAKGYFNSTLNGQNVKTQVEHGDLNSLSIYANQLIEKNKNVAHGQIREVSVVLAGANPEAKIEWVNLQHADGEIEILDDAATIVFGIPLIHEDATATATAEPPTIQEVLDTFDENQLAVMQEFMGEAVKQALEGQAADGTNSDPATQAPDPAAHSNNDPNTIAHKEGDGIVKRNVFEQNSNTGGSPAGKTLSHADMQAIAANAVKLGSLKEAVAEAALEHGVTNIELLFPDAQTLSATPEWNKRRTEWVQSVLSGVSRTPFSKVKSLVADITMDEARAKGYITGTYKKEEWISVSKRTTGSTTIYKKQKLDRDNIIDVTDMDIVAWLWGEMVLMIEEEIARAILLGDGRDPGDPDHIADPMALTSGDGIRSIRNEHELYMTKINVNLDDTNSSYLEAIEAIVRARRFYKGTGRPDFYTTEQTLTEMLLLKDELNSNKRLFRDEMELASALRVNSIVAVEPMEQYPDIIGILVNLTDYNVGTNKGGELTRFDDFDIDYNQYTYLIETRLSGALIKLKSAQVVLRAASAAVLVTPTKPSFVPATGVVTIPAVTGVVYKNADTNATLTAGAQSALAAGASLNVYAVPSGAGYFFADSEVDGPWTFKRPVA